MKILITGSSGTLAAPLANALLAAGHKVIGVSRQPVMAAAAADPAMQIIHWAQLTAGFLGLHRVDAIINLAGAPMMQRWNARSKTAILQSRLKSVRILYGLLRQLPPHRRPECVINASSVAIYSSRTLPVDEFSAVHADDAFFQSRVWHAVESLINELQVPGVRTLITRLGLVIGADTLMDRMLRLSRCYLGATLGDGKQRIGWIARHDMVRAFMHLLGDREHHGIFNLVTPRPITAAQFTQGLAHCVNRPVLLRVPAGLLRLLLGELASNFLISADVMPARLQMTRFNWSLPDFDLAIRSVATELGHGSADAIKDERSESVLKPSSTEPVIEAVGTLRNH